MRKPLPPVSVARGLRGQGVFSTKILKRNQEIAEITGKVIDDPDYTSSYCIDLGTTLSLEPQAPFRFPLYTYSTRGLRYTAITVQYRVTD